METRTHAAKNQEGEMDGKYPDLMKAVTALASVCDGAHDRDTQGFNGPDAKKGNRLATVPRWTYKEAAWAHGALAKYADTQLATMGIDYDSIPKPTPPAGKDIEPLTAGSVELDEAEFLLVKFDYDPGTVGQISSLSDRTWDGPTKTWTVAATFKSCNRVRELAEHHEWKVSDAAAELLDSVINQGSVEPEHENIEVERDQDGIPRRWILRWERDDEKFDEYVAAVKGSISGRRWDGKARFWHAPLSEVTAQEVLSVSSQVGLTMSDEAEHIAHELAEVGEARLKASRLDDADLDVDGLGEGLDLLPFQRAGVAYLASVNRGICGDDMGLGKTVQALATLRHLDTFPAVIIVPASVKVNWQRMVKEWLPGVSVDRLEARDEPMGTQPDVLIVNYDLLSDVGVVDEETGEKVMNPKTGKQMKRPTEAKRSILEADWEALVVDEFHYIKSPGALRSRAVKDIVKALPERAPVLFLSGTPIKQRPIELVNPLQTLGVFDQIFGSWVSFVKRYCAGYRGQFGWETGGASNLEELSEKLRSTCMIRRSKKDVMSELPEKIRDRVFLPLSNRRRYAAAERDVIGFFANMKANQDEFLESIADLNPEERKMAKLERAKDAARSAERAEALVRINTLRQLVGELKTNAVVEWIKDWLESSDGKLVVFAHHRQVQDKLAEEFASAAVHLGGGMSAEAKDAVVQEFIADSSKRLFVGSLGAAGTGIDGLQKVAETAAFVEFQWTPGDMTQAEDRIHRHGMGESCRIIHFAAEGTIDEFMTEQLLAKQKVLDKAMGDGDEEAAAEARSANVMGAVVAALKKKGNVR